MKMYVKCMHQSQDIPFSMRSIDMIRNRAYSLQPNLKMVVLCGLTILSMLTTTHITHAQKMVKWLLRYGDFKKYPFFSISRGGGF